MSPLETSEERLVATAGEVEVCCFSGPVRDVSDTRIFARFSHTRTQFLVYQMTYGADRDLAMILPLPIATPASEVSVRFVNLQGYPEFFNDMLLGFVPVGPDGKRRQFRVRAVAEGGILPVHEVGDFVASFVPTLKDFARLDARFKLPQKVWTQIPAYSDYGFAVFKLRSQRDLGRVHPMAFQFATRMRHSLFLPTVHIHDGRVHPTEQFDHNLYVQDRRLSGIDVKDSWEYKPDVPQTAALIRSPVPAKEFLKIDRTCGIVAPNLPVFKRSIYGAHANHDTMIRCG